MKSITKSRQSKEIIEKMTEKYFAPRKMVKCTELTEGYFNAAYEIELSDGSSTILKIAPDKDVRIMTYEKNIMFSEVQAMRLAGQNKKIPVPQIYGYDNSCTICESPYFFMEKLRGKSLSTIKCTLEKSQTEEIYYETGKILHAVNDIICPCFGYPGQPEYQGKEWYPVFCKMLKAGIEDAEQGNVDLRISTDELLLLLKKDKAVFDEVTEPRLVHWDCWDGNLFAEDGKLTGIIDWERCLWGDPLMEVGFRTYDANLDFQKGYGLEMLDEKQLRRALWYDIYLMILVSLECEYRKYETLDMYYWSTDILMRQFEKLRNPQCRAEIELWDDVITLQ